MVGSFLLQRARRPRGVIAALDIGSSKLACWIIQPQDHQSLRIIGAGLRGTQGFKEGIVTNMRALEEGLLDVLHDAERAAGETVTHVVFSVSAPWIKSRVQNITANLQQGVVGDADLARILSKASREYTLNAQQTVLHALPVAFSIDGQQGIKDPRGLVGNILQASIHCVTAPVSPLKNLSLALERCHVEVMGCVAGGYAAGLGCLVDDEKSLGVIVIDIGACGTNLACFYEGICVYVDHVPLGGEHITHDIARCLEISLASAERLKTLYGTVMPATNDFRESLKIHPLGEMIQGEGYSVPKALLVDIIQARVHDIFDAIREKIHAMEELFLLRQRIVITGGCSQLPGLRDYGAQALGAHVRLGIPVNVEPVKVPSFVLRPDDSVVAGAFRALNAISFSKETAGATVSEKKNVIMKRIFNWLKDNL